MNNKGAFYAVFTASVLLNAYLLTSHRSSTFSARSSGFVSYVERTESTLRTPVPGQLPSTQASQTYPGVPAMNTVRQFNWSAVESSDYKTYVDSLRAAGCPPETVRDIVSQDLVKNYRAKEWELLRHATSTQYWSSSFQTGTSLQSEQLLALRNIADQFNGARKELLGADAEDPFATSSQNVEMEILAMYGDLDWETIEKIAPIQRGLRAEFSRMQAGDSREDELIREAEEKIGSFLSEEQRNVHEMRSSPLAQKLRASNLGLNSEARFREAFFRARSALGNSRDVASISEEDLGALLRR